MNEQDLLPLNEVGLTLLSEGKTLKLRAEGFSMYPSIKPGSLVYIEPADIPALKKGDIVVWRLDPGFVMHRIVRKFEKNNQVFVVTRGDCNLYEDEALPENLIVGKVTGIEYPEGTPVALRRYMKPEPDYFLNRLSATIMRIGRSLKNKIRKA